MPLFIFIFYFFQVLRFSFYFLVVHAICFIHGGCRYWSLKEAYVKAIGSGIVQGLEKVEFHHNNWTNISVEVAGKAIPEWRFWLFELGKGHLVRKSPAFLLILHLCFKQGLL